MAARDELERTAPMKLDHRICPTGEAVVDLGGELDILSADVAVNYVTDVIDRHRGPVTVNLTALAFCDARGLAALVRMAGYAERKGCPFRLASPSPRLIKIMLITRLDRRFLTSQASGWRPASPSGRRSSALTALTTLGLSGAPVHEPVHGPGAQNLLGHGYDYRTRVALWFRGLFSGSPDVTAMTTATSGRK